MKKLTSSGIMSLVMLMYLVKIVIKYYVGGHAHSATMIADAVHGSSDIAAAAVVLAAAAIGNVSIANFNYGLHKIESLLSACVGIFLFYVAWVMLRESLATILATVPSVDATVRSVISLPVSKPAELSSAWPWVVAVSLVTAAISLKVGKWEIGKGKELGSEIIVSDGKETRGDGLVEIGVAVSALAVNLLKTPWLDGAATLVIVLFISQIAWEITRDSVKSLLLVNIGSEITSELKTIITLLPGVVEAIKFQSFNSGKAVVNVKIISRCPLLAQRVMKQAIETVTVPAFTAHGFMRFKFNLRFALPLEEGSRVAVAVVRTWGIAVVARTPEKATHVYVGDIQDGMLVRVKSYPLPRALAAFLEEKKVRHLLCLTPQKAAAVPSVELVEAPHWNLASLGV